jgi:crossover junction endodeoxyribonuclease RuvC
LSAPAIPRKIPVFIGIDPGTHNTGYGLVIQRGSLFKAIAYGVIRPRGEDALAYRLRFIYEQLLAVLDRYSPISAAVEDIFTHRNAQSALTLGHARGVVLLAMNLRGVEVFSYPPAEVKKQLIGHGRAGKEQMQFMTQKLLGLPKQAPQDAADALGLAVYHCLRMSGK